MLRGSPIVMDDSNGWPSLDDGHCMMIRRPDDFGDLAVVDGNTNSSRSIAPVLFESRKIIIILFYLISYAQASLRLHLPVKHNKNYWGSASNAHILYIYTLHPEVHINCIFNVNLFCIIEMLLFMILCSSVNLVAKQLSSFYISKLLCVSSKYIALLELYLLQTL